MEFAKAKEVKDRFIKSSISSLPEHFNTKWEITDELEYECCHNTTQMNQSGVKMNRACNCINHTSTEDDENRIYRAMLQSEVLNVDIDHSMSDTASYSSFYDPYSMMRYSETSKK